MVGGLERQHHDGDRAVRRAGVVGLGRIEDAAVRRIEAGLRDRAHRACGGEKVLEMHRAAGAAGRPVLQPHPGLRDHAEDALGTDHHAVRAWAGAGARQAAALDHALRRHGAQRFDEIVDMGVERREVAAAAGRDPAAERGIFEALREVAQGQAMRAQLRFERGPEAAGFDQGCARGLVDLLDLAHRAQVDGDRAVVAVAPRLDAAADARTAAERRHRGIGRAGPIEHGGDVGFVARIGDDVGRAGIVEGKAARELGVRLAVGVGGAVVVRVAAERKRRGRHDPGSGQRDLFKLRRLGGGLERGAEARLGACEDEGFLVRGQALALAAPAEMLQARSGCRHRSCPDVETSP